MAWPQVGSAGVARRIVRVVAYAAMSVAAFNVSPVARAEQGLAVYGNEERAEELYLDGLEKLAAGHGDFARETFQSVITRYPQTSAAVNARRQLGAEDAQASPGMDLDGPITGSLNLPTLSNDNDVDDVIPAPGPSWDRELRRNASIQSKLRLEAGDRVFFSPGSAELGSRARVALDAQAQWLMRWHEFDAAIEGHADESGTEEDNIVLSQQRAEAVRQRLIEAGVQPNRLAVVPLGRSLRIATCADTDCRAQNRRAVTLVFATGTRERLGLVGGSSSPSGASPGASGIVIPASAATTHVAGPAVGMAR